MLFFRRDRGLQRDKGLDPGIGCDDLYWCRRGLGPYRRIVVGRVQRDGSLRAWHVGGFLGSEMRDGLQGRGCAMGFGNSLPTHRWLKG